MTHRDVIVIGASSGGVSALTKLLGGLPAGLPAAIFVVLHVRENAPSQLPAILNRAGCLPVAHAVDREPIRLGRVYVAPPGQQLYLQRGRISVNRGPRENMQRPAIDALFRTAAHHYRDRVIGIVLSGALDDGSAGLLAIKNAGGVAIVQDPNDAMVPDMPKNAMSSVTPDFCEPVSALPTLLINLVSGPSSEDTVPAEVPLETAEETSGVETHATPSDLGRISQFTCPDCSGTLWEIQEGDTIRYRCRVGHAYSLDTMIEAQGDSVERALWIALRSLEERVALLHRLAEHARQRGLSSLATMYDERSEQADQEVKVVHDVIMAGRAVEPVVEHEA
jgi:two-component system chemotaxis response regulator CheB